MLEITRKKGSSALGSDNNTSGYNSLTITGSTGRSCCLSSEVLTYILLHFPEELTNSPVALTEGNTLGVVLAGVKPRQTGVNHLLTQIT